MTGRLSFLQILAFLGVAMTLCHVASAEDRHFNFEIQYTNVTRLCHTKSLVAVNGQFPGPTSYVTEGDMVTVNVTNLVSSNVTIHWHGVRQLLSGWADGPAYITQCPIQTHHSYVHRFRVVGQRGTLFWHAHFSWLRATVYGAFIIRKKPNTLYPFPKPDQEPHPILIGEWWNANVEDVIAQALTPPNSGYSPSNAITINGQPGDLNNDLYNCSTDDTVIYHVKKGETVLLRIINAALNFHMFFSVANHSLTVVEVDATYTEQYTTDVILLAPGQTTNVLLTANQEVGEYYIAASIFSPPNAAFVPFPATPGTAKLKYHGAAGSSDLTLPTFPVYNDTAFQANFTQTLQGWKGNNYQDLPKTIDKDLLHTVGYALQPCPANVTCQFPFPALLRGALNNVTFVSPNISLLQAYHHNISGVYTTDFPSVPLFQYNYTGVNPTDKFGMAGTRVEVLPFNSRVQIVYQNTATAVFESHPIHLHGQNFYVVGSGSGNYNPSTDPAKFNLVNPVSRNTISVPAGGWAAVRFIASNPGVWFVHCHFDIHQAWGMEMAFITLNGVGPSQTLPPPPSDLPPC